jgi:hypothetical protein
MHMQSMTHAEHAAYRPFILHPVNEGAQLPSLGSVCLFVPVR